MSWSPDKNVLKTIFLVGDCEPHMDYPDGPKYPEVCKAAMNKQIVINTIQCGQIPSTTKSWQEIAKLSEGNFVSIAQTGNMTVMATPMDAKLAELNRKIGSTLIPYGDKATRSAVSAKQSVSESAPAPAVADRLYFNSNTGKTVQGRGELLDEIANSGLKLEEIESKNLPEDLKNLNKSELKGRIEALQNERNSIQKEIATLNSQREAYIKAETKRLEEKSPGESFDQKVAEMMRRQAK